LDELEQRPMQNISGESTDRISGAICLDTHLFLDPFLYIEISELRIADGIE